MDNTRASGDDKKRNDKKRKKCPAGCTCGRHRNKGNDGKNTPIRKSTITKQQMFLDALRMTAGVIEPALEMAGIVRSTYRRWYNDDAGFKQLVDDTDAAQRDFVQTKLMKGIKDGSERLIEFYLDRRDPTFAKRSHLDVTTGGEKVAPSVVFVPASQRNEGGE